MRHWIVTILTFSILIGSYTIWSQEAFAASEKAKSDADITTNTIGMKFKLVQSGSFMMGPLDSDIQIGDDVSHKVTISKPFYIGIYEVTQEHWEKVMGNNPSKFKGANKPVEGISWNDAQEFIQKLSEMEKIEYRLPTDAEWEYACRAGTTGQWYFEDSMDELNDHAWCEANSKGQTHSVGQKKPNPWGLYDMYGNVGELCSDWYDKSGDQEQTDPKGSSSGEFRVVRGGTWHTTKRICNSTVRGVNAPDNIPNAMGFRLVRNVDPKILQNEAQTSKR